MTHQYPHYFQTEIASHINSLCSKLSSADLEEFQRLNRTDPSRFSWYKSQAAMLASQRSGRLRCPDVVLRSLALLGVDDPELSQQLGWCAVNSAEVITALQLCHILHSLQMLVKQSVDTNRMEAHVKECIAAIISSISQERVLRVCPFHLLC